MYMLLGFREPCPGYPDLGTERANIFALKANICAQKSEYFMREAVLPLQ